MVNVGAANPEGGIFCRLRLDSHHCVILCIHPNLAAVKELSIHSWFNLQDIELPAVFAGISNQ
jgi:hypothetical protein